MNEWNPVFREVNYDAKRDISTLEMDSYKYFEANYIKEGPAFSQDSGLDKLLNPMLSWLVICKKIRYIHLVADDLFHRYKQEMSGIVNYPIKETIESIIFHMKAVIDMQVQLCDLLVEHDKIENEHRILIDSYSSRNKNEIVNNIISGNEYYESDDTDFLSILNSVFNSMKHCLLHPEAYSKFGDYPTVVTIYAKSNNFQNEIEYHNHYLSQLIMGFQDNVRRIFKNMRRYQELQENK